MRTRIQNTTWGSHFPSSILDPCSFHFPQSTESSSHIAFSLCISLSILFSNCHPCGLSTRTFPIPRQTIDLFDFASSWRRLYFASTRTRGTLDHGVFTLIVAPNFRHLARGTEIYYEPLVFLFSGLFTCLWPMTWIVKALMYRERFDLAQERSQKGKRRSDKPRRFW